jgi:hypothetical protein
MTLKHLPLLVALVDLAFLQSNIFAQSFTSFPDGIGVEIGGGQNNFYWRGNGPQGPFGWEPMNYTRFYLTPNVRLTYHTSIIDGFALLPFTGYNEFGGTANISGNHPQYSFQAFELGTALLYEFAHISVGVGFKEKLGLSVRYRDAQANINEDYTKVFSGWYDDAGVRCSYYVSPITFSLEGWFSVSNMAGPNSIITIQENHFRFLVGYTF